MELYLSDTEKSSESLPTDYRTDYGISLVVATYAINAGMGAHMRIYDALLRFGWYGLAITAAEISRELSFWGIPLSPAQAQRVLKDERLFTLKGERKTGKRGRQAKLYYMVDLDKIAAMFRCSKAAGHDAPRLKPSDISTALRYKLAISARLIYWHDEENRYAQMRTWNVSKPTIIRWTRETCHIFPQIERLCSDDYHGGDRDAQDLFLLKVMEAATQKPHKFWLEVINRDGEIRKLPCSKDNAQRWLKRDMPVTLCEQMPNYYSPRSPYRDPSPWNLPY